MTIPSTIRPREGEQPGTPYEAFKVGATLGPLELSVDSGIARAYMELHACNLDWYRTAGDATGALLPPAVLSLYLLPILCQRYLPLQGIVLTRQEFSFHCSLRPEEPLNASGKILEKYARRGRHFVRRSAEFRTVEGALVTEAVNTFMLRE